MPMKVYITRKIPEAAINLLSENFEISMWCEEHVPVPRDVLEQEIQAVDAIYCLLTDTIDRSLLEKAKHLKVISIMAVGYNNIDIKAAKELKIIVTNTPGVLTETTADLTFALMLATARRVVESQQFLKAGQWKTWSPMLLTGQDVFGAKLGIIGMGRIGEAIVKRAIGFNMPIVYYNRTRKVDIEEKYGITFVPMEQLLSTADFICIMTPLTQDTYHLIGERELQLMKETAILINTARGGIVDEQALYNALDTQKIWAAGLDVFEEEPVPLDHPLLTLPNVIVLPHIGSASIQTRSKMSILAANQLISALTGIGPEHRVV